MLQKYDILRNAEKHVINRNLNQAIREYERIAEQEADDPGIQNTLGDLLLKDGRRDEALARFRRVAEIYVQSGFLSKAIAICKKIHRLDPRDDEINSRLIDLFSRQGLNSEAIRHLEGLVEQSQTWGQLDSAIAYQEKVLSLDSNRPEGHLTAARLSHQLNDGERAHSHYLIAAQQFRNRAALDQSYEIAREALRVCGESQEMSTLLVEVGQTLASQLRDSGNPERAEVLEQDLLELKSSEDTESLGQEAPPATSDNPSSENLVINSTSDIRGFDLLSDDEERKPEADSGEDSDRRPSFADYLFGSNSESEPADDSQNESFAGDGMFPLEEQASPPEFEVETDLEPDANHQAAGQHVQTSLEEPSLEQDTESHVTAEDWEGSLDEALQEADFYLKLGLKDDARSLIEKLIRAFPSDERVRQRAVKAAVELPEPVPMPSESSEMAEALRSTKAFGLEVESALDGLFTSEVELEPAEVLRYDVTSTGRNSKDDPRVHYDLGMAYKEMGLLEDAIEKFQDAYQLFTGENSAAQKILCCSMLSTAYNQLKNFEQAIRWSEEGLSLPDEKEFEWKALQYDRCYALEEMGETDQALEGYATILDKDPSYRDVSQRVEVLTVQVDGQ